MANKYQYIKIGLASPETIRSWSYGEVKTHETINYRTLKPEFDGLFCERIFGPMKDNTCACGKSKKNGENQVCPHCGVEITSSKVRRERMGHINLKAPVVHPWFLKSSLHPIANLIGIKKQDLLDVVYYSKYIVVDKGNVDELSYKQVLSEYEYDNYMDRYFDEFQALTGGEAIKKLLEDINLREEETRIMQKLQNSSKQERLKCTKRLEVVRAFLNSDNKPEWMVLTVLPVLPPDLRPMVPLDGGRFATTDINDLYRDIIMRNSRIDKFSIRLCAQNEKRILQVAVDNLIGGSAKSGSDKSRQRKSLTNVLTGKQGRFRQNLLGKRVDYSGRSVIVIGPNLKMYQCGIPREMAIKLFEPHVMAVIRRRNPDLSVKECRKRVVDRTDDVWNILQQVVREHPVLLNRAPTLHRLSIQAFEPVLIDGKAIRLHPLVCTAFNADFDGDQMAVHVPISVEAQAEARLLMLASNNILNPKDGKPVVTPSQDMVLGNYYLTIEKAGLPNEFSFYTSFDEAYLAYKNNIITLHTRIFVDPSYLPATRFANFDVEGKYLLTTVGKMIFNEIIPADFPYINEPAKKISDALSKKSFFCPKTETFDDFKANIKDKTISPFNKSFLAIIIAAIFKKHKVSETSAMLDRLKDLGFKYSTVSGITISMADVIEYKDKKKLVDAADDKVNKMTRYFELGWISDNERKRNIEEIWKKTRDDIEKGLWKELSALKDNSIFMMADSKARGSSSNFSQLAGMRGLMSNTAGESIEIPVKANFREGLSVSEFFISTHGARKGSTDTALKTADSGYLTRRLVDVAQDVVIREDDCGTDRGMWLEAIYKKDDSLDDPILSVAERALGRYAAADILDKEGNLICKRNDLINEEIADKIEKAELEGVYVRTNLTCACKLGVCKKCYGRNLATNELVEVGEAVGVVAAQSIGEPGTQLTMRTFHNGGVASSADITQGLPRVQELFDLTRPKGRAILSELDGVVTDIKRAPNGDQISISNSEENGTYTVDVLAEKVVKKDSEVKRGQPLVHGAIFPTDLLHINNLESAQKYIVQEIQRVYRDQGVEIADKHIEIIVRQMTRFVRVIESGDTNLIPGNRVTIFEFRKALEEAIRNNKTSLPKAKPDMLGLVKAGVHSDSFLSAASFQQTTSVLASAAIRSSKDPLVGLKENVIIGGLIPAGTGILHHKATNFPVRPVEQVEEEIIEDLNPEIEEIIEDFDENEEI